jgi:hypothetical protein
MNSLFITMGLFVGFYYEQIVDQTKRCFFVEKELIMRRTCTFAQFELQYPQIFHQPKMNLKPIKQYWMILKKKVL